MVGTDAIKRLKSIFDSAVDGIIIINHIGIIEEVNPAATKLFIYEEKEILGKNVSILMHTDHKSHHDKYIENYKTTRQPKIIGLGREVIGRKKNGELFPFWLAVSEVKLEDRTIFTGFIHDLSEIKSAEIDLLKLNKELEKKVIERTYELEKVVNRLLFLNKEYETEIESRIKTQQILKEREAELEKSLEKEKELSELKSRFVSMASHEFRTPLSTILSSVSLIGRYELSEQQENREKHIGKVKNSVTQLTNILNDFLSVNKLEEGKVRAMQEEFDLIELMHIVKEELILLLKKNQHLSIDTHLDKAIVVSDNKIIKNIMINLITNAIKYSKDDGVITCRIKDTADSFLFSVIDQGIGIPEDEQKHLFDRFFRASNSTNIEGTGLGLNIVKKYVDMLGGNIEFKSKQYSGSTFTVTLPVNL